MHFWISPQPHLLCSSISCNMQIQTSTQTQATTIVEQCMMTLKLDSSASFVEDMDSNSIFGRANVPGRSFSGFMVYPESSSSSSLIGEYIGVESCLDLSSNEDMGLQQGNVMDSSVSSSTSSVLKGRTPKKRREKVKKREFPPPIPLLAQTGNLTSRMPWVLKRHYTSDGRLILTEEKVMHHEYFRAHRSNGRLTLQLVPVDAPVPMAPELQSSSDTECSYLSDSESRTELESAHDIANDDARYTISNNQKSDGEEGKASASSIDDDTNTGGNGVCLSCINLATESDYIFRIPVATYH